MDTRKSIQVREPRNERSCGICLDNNPLGVRELVMGNTIVAACKACREVLRDRLMKEE